MIATARHRKFVYGRYNELNIFFRERDSSEHEKRPRFRGLFLLQHSLLRDGGADENRTRVRKQIHFTFSERRLCLTFPRPKLHNQSYDLSSLLFMAKAETSSAHVHHLNDASVCAVVLTEETTLRLRQRKLIRC